MVSWLLSLLFLGVVFGQDDDFTEFEDADRVLKPPPQVILDPINGIITGGGFSNFGPEVKCPVGASFNAFMIKTGPTNSYFTESSGITGIQLRCNSLPQKKLTSLHSSGRWEKKFSFCQGDRLLTGLKLRISRESATGVKIGGGGQPTSVTGISFLCADTLGNTPTPERVPNLSPTFHAKFTWHTHAVDVPQDMDSEWGEESVCPDLYAAVGFKTTLGSVAMGSRLNTVSVICEKRWDDCRACDNHGTCVLKQNATEHLNQVCQCSPGWHGPYCTWHLNPQILGTPQVRSAEDGNPYLIEGTKLECVYNDTLDGSIRDTSRTLIQWFYGEEMNKVIWTGRTIPGHLTYAGVKISCVVEPCDNFPVSFCGNKTISIKPALISGVFKFSGTPMGWKSFDISDIHIYYSTFMAGYEEVDSYCNTLGARPVILPPRVTQTELAIALRSENIEEIWMKKFGKTVCKRFSIKGGKQSCTKTAEGLPIRATCMKFFSDDQVIPAYAFRKDPSNWITAQGTCKQQYAGNLTPQFSWLHVNADVKVLKLYEQTQAWNGGAFDADPKIWKWSVGANMTSIMPWKDNEPRLNGYDLARCVVYEATNTTKIWKVNECLQQENPYICAGKLLDIHPTTTELIIRKPASLYNNVDPLFSVSVMLPATPPARPTVLAEYTLEDLASPVEVPGVPGTEYLVRFRATQADVAVNNTVKAVDLTVKTSCDCDLDPYRDGAPTNLTALQANGTIRFSWEVNSACATSWTLTRDGNFLMSQNYTAYECKGIVPRNVSDPVAFEAVMPLQPGLEPEYCLYLRNNETGYAAPATCKRVRIEFYGIANMEIHYDSPGVLVPVQDAQISYYAYDGWGGTSGKSERPDMRDDLLFEQGRVITDVNGTAPIHLQSGRFNNADIIIQLVLSPATLKPFDPLVIIGDGVGSGVYACEKYNRFVLPPPTSIQNPNNRLFPANRDSFAWVCFINMTHGVTRKFPIYDKLPMKTVHGFVSFPVEDRNRYLAPNDRCPVFNATVCYRHTQGKREYCNQTDASGAYILYVPEGTYNVSAYVAIAGGKYMARPKTCANGRSVGEFHCQFNSNQVRATDRPEFSVTEKRKIQIQAYGGSAQCTQPLGNAEFILRSHPDEQCQFRWDSIDRKGPLAPKGLVTQDADPLVVSVYPMRYIVEFFRFADAGRDDTEQQKNVRADAAVFFYLTFSEGQFMNLRDVGEGRYYPAIFEYHTQIEIDIVRVGDEMDDCNGVPVHRGYPNRIPIRIEIHAWEVFGEYKCPVTGSVLWYDGLIDKDVGDSENAKCDNCYEGCYGDSAGCAIRLTVPEGRQDIGQAFIQTIPGRPRATPPWTRSVTIKAYQRGGVLQEVTKSIILTGEGTTPVPFADSVPDVAMPSVFLYDPPGGASYSLLEEGTVLTDEYSLEFKSGTNVEQSASFGMGQSVYGGICTGALAVDCPALTRQDTGKWGISGSVGFNLDTSTENGYSNSITLTTEITTSKNPGMVDGMGDVIVMKVISFQHLPTYKVAMNKSKNTCKITRESGEFKWLPSIDGIAIYNMWDVHNMIPRLQADIANMKAYPPNPSWSIEDKDAFAARYAAIESGIDLWEGVIKYWRLGRATPNFQHAVRWDSTIAKLCKGDCTDTKTGVIDSIVNFGAGAAIEYTMETVEKFEDKTTYDAGFGFGIGFSASVSSTNLGLNINFGTKVNFKQSFNWITKRTRGLEKTTKVGFHLNDEDFGDSFTVEILYNTFYKVPMFRLLGGASRCPHETGTIQRNKIHVAVDAAEQFNVLPDAIVPFRITIAALETENLAGMNYVVFLRQDTNNNGAQIHWDGLPIDNELGINLRNSGEYYMDMTRSRDYYNYTGVTMDFFDQCESQLDEENALSRAPYLETISLSALFLQPCAKIAWSEDYEKDVTYHFVLNAANMDRERIRVSVVNPGFPNVLWKENLHFDRVAVLYRHIEYQDWNLAHYDFKNEIEAWVNETDYGYMTFEIDTSQWVIEGNYQIILRSYCQYADASALPSEFLNFETPVRMGIVDRTPPRVFGFPSPANGRYLPGDFVGLTFQEPIDCNKRNYPNGKFNVTISWGGGARPQVHSADDNYLFFLCDENKFTITWGFAMDISPLLEKEVTIRVQNIQDIAGNVMSSPVEWTFIPTTYVARSAMLKIDGLELAGVTPADFIADYYTKHKIAPDDRIVTDTDPFSSFGIAFCSKFDEVIQVERMRKRCELLKYYVDERFNTFVTFAITPGTPSASAIFEQFKNSLESMIPPTPNATRGNNHTSSNSTTPTPSPSERRNRRKRAEPNSNLMGAVKADSTKTSWDMTTDSDTIRSTLKQPLYPLRYFEAITLVPAGLFVTMAIGMMLGAVVLIAVLIFNKQREKHWNGKVTEKEKGILPFALQEKFKTSKSKEYELH